jgi:hypothetical protein
MADSLLANENRTKTANRSATYVTRTATSVLKLEERGEAERRDQVAASDFRDLQDHVPDRPPGLLALVEALCVDGLHIGTVRLDEVRCGTYILHV